MRTTALRAIGAALLLCAAAAGVRAGSGKTMSTPERRELPAQHKWKTEHLYRSDAAFEQDRKQLLADLAAVAGCKGTLQQGTAAVKRCLDAVFGARKRLARLNTYARRRHDEDTRVTKYAGLKNVMDAMDARYNTSVAFLEPELLALPEARLRELTADKQLADYDHYLRQLLRRKGHVLSPPEEALLAKTTQMQRAGYNAYTTFTGAEMQFPEVRVGKQKVRLTQALYTRLRAEPDRAVRQTVFESFFGAYQGYRRTLAQMLATQVEANIAVAQIRRYKSALEAALDVDNVPVAVYQQVIKAVHEHLPLLHRYLKLRKQLLGVDELRYYDMYPSIIGQVALDYPYDAGRKLILDALAPLGPQSLAALKKGLDPQSGWIDVFPNQGKRSGAYMDGDAYDVHPFVLTNYLDNYESVSTMAHEMGHALHSYLTNASQPFSKAAYSIFLAEIASTTNEMLLLEHLLDRERDPNKRLFLLGQRMESFRTTIFRQVMFAEFELEVYRAAEQGKPLTDELLSAAYLALLRKYHGHEAKVVRIDELYGMEWAYIPHFYYNFYVFQYATGMTAATALAEAIRKPGTAGRERYVKLLKAGASDYAITLLRQAGVDLRDSKPYAASMAVFRRTLDEAERIVAARPRPGKRPAR